MYLGKIVELADGRHAVPEPEAPLHGGAAVGGPDRRPGPGRARRSGSSWRATCPRRSTRRRAAGSTRAARGPSSRRAARSEPELTPHHPGQVAACHFPLEDRAIVAGVSRLAAESLDTPDPMPSHAERRSSSSSTSSPPSLLIVLHPAALGQGERAVRHVRRRQRPLRRHRDRAPLDQITVVTADRLRVLTFWLAWKWIVGPLRGRAW